MKNQEEKEDEYLVELPNKIAISDIDISKARFRKDPGDLRPLVDSIKRHGLLHPVVVTEDKPQLICGRRRISAYMQLGKTEIEVTYINANSTNLREAEADENVVRKDFTVEEIEEIDEFYREREETAAKQRQKAVKG